MNTHNLARFASLLALVLALNSASADVFTPVIASTLSPEAHPIRGTDGAYHVVYELQLTNTKSLPATIRSIDVLAGASGSEIITSFSGADLLKRLRTLAPEPAKDAIIEPNEIRQQTVRRRARGIAKHPEKGGVLGVSLDDLDDHWGHHQLAIVDVKSFA